MSDFKDLILPVFTYRIGKVHVSLLDFSLQFIVAFHLAYMSEAGVCQCPALLRFTTESCLHFTGHRRVPDIQASVLDIIELLGYVKHCKGFKPMVI